MPATEATVRETDPDILVDVTTEATPFAAEITRRSLEDAGIPAFAATTVGMWLPWHFASTEPHRIQVRRRDLAAAQAELALQRTESSSIDWDAEEIGSPVAEEDAALRPADPEWAAHREERRSVAQTMIWLASMAAFGPVAIVIMLTGGVRWLVRRARGLV